MHESQPALVVILEDDAEVTEILELVLRGLGVRVLICPLRQEVLACIRETQPQLVVSDVRMGALDGIAIFQQLRADASTRHIPVIFFTATEQRVRSRLPDYQQQDAYFVGKPNLPALVAAVRDVLQLHP